jgi:hypothetical protein
MGRRMKIADLIRYGLWLGMAATADANRREAVEDTLTVMVRDNPAYAVYAAPLAVGYILSHPRCNIYKGEWAEKRFCGLSFDAIPHAATAFALTALLCDTFRAAPKIVPPRNPLAPLLRWTRRNPALASMSVLALITLVWEGGEYRIHLHEMSLRGDLAKINMMWSVQDTANDVAANLAGWALALLYDRARDATVEP